MKKETSKKNRRTPKVSDHKNAIQKESCWFNAEVICLDQFQRTVLLGAGLGGGLDQLRKGFCQFQKSWMKFRPF